MTGVGGVGLPGNEGLMRARRVCLGGRCGWMEVVMGGRIMGEERAFSVYRGRYIYILVNFFLFFGGELLLSSVSSSVMMLKQSSGMQ